MKSSLQCKKKSLNSPGVLWRALLGSLALHALAFGMLMPEFGGEGYAVPPSRVLQGQLALPVLPADDMPPLPLPDPPPPTHKPRQSLSLTAPPTPAFAAVTPEPTFEPPPHNAADSGGISVPRDTTNPATVAMPQESRDAGPDAAGLRQYRLALAGEARRYRRYPEAARREGLAGTAEVRIAVAFGERQTELARSSGHAMLDAAALEMLRQAAARTRLPESLRGQQFAVLLPVVFEVEE